MAEKFMEELSIRGLSDLFRNCNDYWRKRNQDENEFRDLIIKEYPNLLEGRIEQLDLNSQYNILSRLVKERSDLFFQDYWSEFVNSLVKKANRSSVLDNQQLYLLAGKIKEELEDEFDWVNLVKVFVSALTGRRYIGNIFPAIVEKAAKSQPKLFVKFMHNRDVVGYTKEIREVLYKNTISGGLLDKKIARRIRSDASQYTSYNGAEALFANLHLYSAEVQEELILQFSDTRHSDVAYLMVRKTPEELLPFLVGLTDDWALKMLEKRLDEIALRKERERKELEEIEGGSDNG